MGGRFVFPVVVSFAYLLYKLSVFVTGFTIPHS